MPRSSPSCARRSPAFAREDRRSAARRRARRRRTVVLRRRRHRLDARGDDARRRGQRAGRDGDGRDVRGDRHLPGARSSPASTGAALGGGMGLCAVADLVIAESGTRFGFTETRLGILPAVISPFVDREDRRDRMPGRCSRAAAGSMRSARSGSASSTRSSRARTALDAAVDAADRRRARGGPDRGPRGQGDRPRGPRPRPRVGEVAHGAGDRPAADERRGPGRLRGVHREAPTVLVGPIED